MLVLYPAGAVASLGLLLWGWRLTRSTGLEEVERDLAAATTGAVERQGLVIRLVDALGRGGQRTLQNALGRVRLQKLDHLLDAAGRPEGLTSLVFLQRVAGFTVLGALCSGLLLLAGRGPLAAAPFVMAAAWMPVWLRAAAARRQAQIASQLPDFLDVLAVTVTAGLGLKSALERVSSADGGPLGEEVATVLDDLRFGESRRRAFERLRERNTAPAVTTFTTALLQAEELGTPISGALTDIAAEVRRERGQRVRQAAAKASPKVSLAVTLFIVPGSLLLIVAALVLAQLPRLQVLFS